jgi:hypothetical protein
VKLGGLSAIHVYKDPEPCMAQPVMFGPQMDPLSPLLAQGDTGDSATHGDPRYMELLHLGRLTAALGESHMPGALAYLDMEPPGFLGTGRLRPVDPGGQRAVKSRSWACAV